jgi:hypothetical protein
MIHADIGTVQIRMPVKTWSEANVVNVFRVPSRWLACKSLLTKVQFTAYA